MNEDDDVMLQVKLPYPLLEQVDKARDRLGLSRRGLVTILLTGFVAGDITLKAENASIRITMEEMRVMIRDAG